MDILQLILDNPITAGVLASVGLFVKPIANALQRALVRRIDQAWPGGDAEADEETCVRHTVDAVSSGTLLPRSMVESAVRKHKSISPPAGEGGSGS